MRPERADRLVLEILDADVRRVAEHPPEPPLLARGAEADDMLPVVLRGRAADRLRAADRHDLHAGEVVAEPERRRDEGAAVGDPFDEDDGHARKLA